MQATGRSKSTRQIYTYIVDVECNLAFADDFDHPPDAVEVETLEVMRQDVVDIEHLLVEQAAPKRADLLPLRERVARA
jgi:hypothetical protein